MQDQYNFNRYEKKYILNEEEYRNFMALIYLKLEYDHYNKYRICNIYFDTLRYDLIQNSIEKPVYKEKLRIRSYGVPTKEDMVFVEMKKKFAGVVYKRRVSLSYGEAIDFCVNGDKPSLQNQTINEIDWLMQRYDLHPVLFLSYERLAMKGIEDKNLRITFDHNIRWRSDHLDLREGDFGMMKIIPGQYIMEIKALESIPVWLASALNTLEIYPKSYSKYGMIYKENLLWQGLEEVDLC